MQTAAEARLGRPPARLHKVLAAVLLPLALQAWRGRAAGGGIDAWRVAQAPLDLSFGAQPGLRLGDGVSLVRGDVSDALPPVAWVRVGSVPEPATLLLWLARPARLRRSALPAG